MSTALWIVGGVTLLAFFLLCWLGATDRPDILDRPKR